MDFSRFWFRDLSGGFGCILAKSRSVRLSLVSRCCIGIVGALVVCLSTAPEGCQKASRRNLRSLEGVQEVPGNFCDGPRKHMAGLLAVLARTGVPVHYIRVWLVRHSMPCTNNLDIL